jgi:5-methylcytosine-specific restriction protein B
METNKRVWLYAPGEQANKWNECVANGIICLGWESLGDLTQYSSRQEIEDKLFKESGKRNTNDSLANWQFSHEIKVGDIVFAKKGRSNILGMGTVTSGYSFDDSREDYKSIIGVNWTDTGEWTIDNAAPVKTLTDITKYTNLVDRYTKLVKNNIISQEKCNYWLLCSNAKSWNMSGWMVGQSKKYTIYTESGTPRPVYQNFNNAKPGDVVLYFEGNNTNAIIGMAIVTSECDIDGISLEKIESFNSPLEIELIKGIQSISNMQVFQYQMQSGFYVLTENEYKILFDLIREQNPVVRIENWQPYTREDFLKEVFIKEDELTTLESILKTKKNIILQGAPGVGKTFSARRLAYELMGEKAKNRVALVQFHQNYSYEDFIMGYKPNGNEFVLQRGIFYKFCVDAANDPDRDYFFIIDEINRGNLSKIFGELLMLIEKDYRGTKLTLAYKDEKFFVPTNLYIIGMMNTADRSLAMIDYALRRRFSFYSMKPGFDSLGFKSYQHKLNNPKFDSLIKAVKQLNEKIVSDNSLGNGFEIGHSYFCGQDSITDAWLYQVVNYDIIPLISEYWFDNKQEVNRWSDILNDAIK